MKLSTLSNALVGLVLRSPLRGLLSKSVMLVTFTGRKSHHPITLPVNYLREGDTLYVISSQDRAWWRNLRGGAPVRLSLDGQELAGSGEVIETADSVAVVMRVWARRTPAYGKYLGLRLDSAGIPNAQALARVAAGRVVVRFRPVWTTRPAMDAPTAQVTAH